MGFVFLKGLLIGFAIAAPVGPIGILCIQRSLQYGFRIGWMTGLGAALADGFYGVVVAVGLTELSSFLVAHQSWIRGLGGLCLLYLGGKVFVTEPPHQINPASRDGSRWRALSTTFLLTLANPLTILSFVAVLTGLGLGEHQFDAMRALCLVLGVTVGSAAWWFLLSAGVAFVLHRVLGPSLMRWVNRCSGLVLFAFGLWAVKGAL